jgi:hypothetical protein
MDFYYLPGSAPCRAVMMTAKAVGVELNLKLTNLMAGEHMKPEFLKVRIVKKTTNEHIISQSMILKVKKNFSNHTLQLFCILKSIF